jgi:hypothetical protein
MLDCISYLGNNMKKLIYTWLLLYGSSCREHTKLKTSATEKDTAIKILLSGLPDNEALNTLNAVAKKYGFSYHQVGGCVIPKALRDSIFSENLKTYHLLNKRFGPDWRSKFETEVDSVRKSRW